jgi:acyl carrier protein
VIISCSEGGGRQGREKRTSRKLKDVLVKTFEVREDQVALAAHLIDDLELDSLDWVDLVVRLKQEIGHEITEDELKTIRTIADILDVVEKKESTAT